MKDILATINSHSYLEVTPRRSFKVLVSPLQSVQPPGNHGVLAKTIDWMNDQVIAAGFKKPGDDHSIGAGIQDEHSPFDVWASQHVLLPQRKAIDLYPGDAL